MRRSREQDSSAPAFPGYSALHEIGGGGFATVYRATEDATGRFVALKVLRVAGRSPQVVEAFEREVRALGALSSHPNIVTLYRTLITTDGRPVLVMELARGSMAERIREGGPLPVHQAVAVGIKIAGALETAHRSGLLHRDLKPQNILITHYDEPALADFGVAALRASAQATEGIFGFTTLHAPPEVLEGQQLSPATDVYGLASTLYQLLSGQAPFSAFDGEAPASVILRILRDPVTPLRAGTAVPISLSDLLTEALAKDPCDRPSSALALAEALGQVEALEGWPATPIPVWGEAATDARSPSASSEPTAPPSDIRTPAPVAQTPASRPSLSWPDAAPPSPPVPALIPSPATRAVVSQPRPGVVAPVAGGRDVINPGALPPLPPLDQASRYRPGAAQTMPPAPPVEATQVSQATLPVGPPRGAPAGGSASLRHLPPAPPLPAGPAAPPRGAPSPPRGAPSPPRAAPRAAGSLRAVLNPATTSVDRSSAEPLPTASPPPRPRFVDPQPPPPPVPPAPLPPVPATQNRAQRGSQPNDDAAADSLASPEPPVRPRDANRWNDRATAPRSGVNYEETLAPAGLAAALRHDRPQILGGPAKTARPVAAIAVAIGVLVILAALIALLLTGVI